MAVREIIFFPERGKELLKKSMVVPFINNKVIRLIQYLKDTLKANVDGIGLAASQINIQKRVVVVCPGAEVDGEWQVGLPLVLVNPIVVKSGDGQRVFDGCLSFPGLFDRIFNGFNAVMIHHVIDHLDGKSFIDPIENTQDLYTLQLDEYENLVRLSVSLEQYRNPPDHARFP